MRHLPPTLLLLLLSALLFPRLDMATLWVDEGWTARFTEGASPADVVRAVRGDLHPPFYFLGVWGARQVLGDSELGLRVWGAVGYLVAGAALYAWGRRLGDAKTGASALLMFVLADKGVDFALEARHYTWLMAWVALANLTLIRHLYKPSLGTALIYGLCVLGGLYTHNIFVFLLALQSAYALWARRGIRSLLIVGGGVVLLYLPWFVVGILTQLDLFSGLNHALPANLTLFRLLAPDYLGRPVLLFVGLTLWGAWVLRGQKGAGLALWGVLWPHILFWGLPRLYPQAGFLTERNLTLILPPLALMMGAGVAAFPPRGRAVLTAFLLLNGLFSTHSHQLVAMNGEFLRAPPRLNPPWRDVAALVVVGGRAGDAPLVLDVGGDYISLAYHVARASDTPPRTASLYPLARPADLDPLSYLRFEVLGEAGGLWLVQMGGEAAYPTALEGWGYQRTGGYTLDYSLIAGRVAQRIHLLRYDSPALLETILVTFGGRIRLHAFSCSSQGGRDSLRVNLWWSALSPITEDYSISVRWLGSEGRLIAQHDASPLMPTSTWQVERLVYDAHDLPVTGGGEGRLGLVVYGAGGALLTAEGAEQWTGQ